MQGIGDGAGVHVSVVHVFIIVTAQHHARAWKRISHQMPLWKWLLVNKWNAASPKYKFHPIIFHRFLCHQPGPGHCLSLSERLQGLCVLPPSFHHYPGVYSPPGTKMVFWKYVRAFQPPVTSLAPHLIQSQVRNPVVFLPPLFLLSHPLSNQTQAHVRALGTVCPHLLEHPCHWEPHRIPQHVTLSLMKSHSEWVSSNALLITTIFLSKPHSSSSCISLHTKNLLLIFCVIVPSHFYLHN